MTSSMTGFFFGEKDTKFGNLVIEIKTLNSRYCELQLKLGDDLRVYESQIREIILGGISRGKIDCRIFLRPNEVSFNTREIDEKEIKALEIADKKYKDFLATKELQEDKLFHTVRDIGNQLTAKLERLNKVREWDKSFDDFKPKEDGVDYFINKLDDCCYQEANKMVKKNHKVYNKLQDMKTASRVILHTGSDINSTVTTLKSEMAKAGIDLPVPTHLLQLSQ